MVAAVRLSIESDADTGASSAKVLQSRMGLVHYRP